MYIKFNSNRRPKFRIRTEIRQEGGKILVYKIAGNKIAEDFLKNIIRTYKKLKKLKLSIKTNQALLIDNQTARLEYITGSTMLEKLAIVAKEKAYKKCILLFKDLESIIDRFPTQDTTLSTDFVKLFGKYRKKSYISIRPGILDINLDNILFDKEGIPNLIDYEWSFNFGIPKRYILYRAIYYSFVQLGSVLESSIKIEDIEKEFEFTESEIREYFKWEINFQEYVSGIKIDLNEILKYRKSFHEDTRVNNTMIIDRREFENKISTYEDKIRDLKNEVNSFDSFKKGKIWKTIQKYRKLKSYFVK
ncbi:MAG: hypothetical protein UR34_C0020G0002 [candidate division WS6 bacterium GW2011_GWC1_33_20]|uniref:Aminoglycoside phosphotransferase domain-containing protein n=1 Tax=candidate division WS6 bacterium GW2011_GWC1_33_20 TaxID=1619089 RepID=A0A0F9ZG81_9BACT|nr:MAG: hypothetical protein UR34_C0020G0002 [candidate division WS6 bacterium GW2011_GWC1_33_20]KKP44967.1 MAG: hypothetical protein UR36_C0012G0012 [candidate division WS6 bacterium GW2011_GWF1_33_233]KKP54479.1 MAG: hypothetical protein UR45_C0014G0012 [candidate division WS6 bacterium GW2011_WS6_33_547]